jgi:hypothetical protein
MKKTLIAAGRLADIVEPGATFPVHESMRWVDCPDDTAPDTHEWNGTAVVAKPGPSLDELKASRRPLIDRARNAACYADVPALGHTWQADARSQDLLSNAIRRAHAGKPLPPVWRTADNVDMPIESLADLEAIEDAIAAQTLAAYQQSWSLKAQLDVATTPEEVEAIQWV